MVGVVGELRLYKRSRCAEHGRVVTARRVACARPTGGNHGRTAGNFAQDTTRQSEGRAKCDGTNQRGQGQYKGRSPKAPTRLAPRPGRGGGGATGGMLLCRPPVVVATRSFGRPRRIPRSLNPSEAANLPVYFGHGQRRHRSRRSDGQPQGSR